MKDRPISSEESLRIIEEMMTLTKDKLNHSGFHFILWGLLVMIASLTQYIMATNETYSKSYWIWAVITVVGVIIALIYERGRNKRGIAKSKFGRTYNYLWLGFGITIMVVVHMSISNHINPIGYVLSLVGLATFVSGAIMKFTPFYIGALIFWISAAICPHINEINQLLLNATAIFLGYIIPGILLWRSNNVRV